MRLRRVLLGGVSIAAVWAALWAGGSASSHPERPTAVVVRLTNTDTQLPLPPLLVFEPPVTEPVEVTTPEPEPESPAPPPDPPRAPQVASEPRSATSPLSPTTNIELGRQMSAAAGWVGEQWECLFNLWMRESGWNHLAANPSGAYGIPQALPGSKMGLDWESNPHVQINWGLGYIEARYGNPCGAWSAFLRQNWY